MKNKFIAAKFLISEPEYQICSDLMSRVDDLAPSDSKVKAKIKKLADGSYHTMIAIEATCGKFFSEAKTFSLVASLRQAQENILNILADWKSHRFQV